MRRHRARVAVIPLIAIMAACTGAGPGTSPAVTVAPSTPPPSAQPSATDQPSAAPSLAQSDGPSAEPVPSDQVGDFTCDLPIVDGPTVARAQIVDVRVGEHDGYDRVVFEFENGLPEFSLDRASPPFTQDASGLPIEVEGDSFLGLIMRGGTKQRENNTSSYDGPRDFPAGLASLVHLIEGGDFEAQSTWYFGLSAESCVRVLRLVGEGGSPRLVIDVEH
jgi:hypothetical protein